MISIHALREEGDAYAKMWNEWFRDISIHALREEGDSLPHLSRRAPTDFYPRPPRGGRPETGASRLAAASFLSTPSARRATLEALRVILGVEISIHALREEGDPA